MNRFRIYCGPTCVHTLAGMLRKADINVTCEGTEHVYVETWFTLHELFTAIKGLPFGLNYSDLTYIGKPLCPACGSEKPVGQSCGCFDNGGE